MIALCLAVFAGVAGVDATTLSQPLAGVSIVLDPGHGGSDPGAVGKNGLKESETNLRVARYLAKLLESDGARVVLTRNADIFLSLPARVEIAKKEAPDLFVSIHHNASLRPNAPNKGEIYFNALDRGVPLTVGSRMRDRLQESSIGTGTTVIPGGFYVLRENEIPAVLTEAAYISVPEIEKKLRTGRALVDQARAFQLAIREAFEIPPLRLEVVGKKPSVVSTPYFQLLVSSSRPIAKLETRMEPAFKAGFTLDMIPAFGHVYTLSNTQPIESGEYTLLLSGTCVDRGRSPLVRIPLSVQLPVESAVILPVVPYIPEGLAGSFPVTIQMLDSLERPNQRRIEFSLTWMGRRIDGTTGPDGRAGVVIPLSGAERAGFSLELHADGRKVAVMPIALKAADEQFVIGRVVSAATGAGIDRMTVSADNRQTALTNPDGYFALSMPMRAFNITMNINPTTGYLPGTFRHKTDGKNVQTPLITLTPRAPVLLGRRIGIIAQREQDPWVRPLVKALMQGGARVRRLPTGSGMHPEHDAITTANLEGGYDLLVAMKPGAGTTVELRHYHRSKVGKALALAVVNAMGRQGGVKACAGSDYELGHTGTPALVVQ
ncbi:MAG TPA: N-acetylmuramoyl-L-alanine amidase, partial [Candidatus Ozemobacteraceae bacterium]|nr:N-acetylmuramoyl-L-alanine amidase [Candidatus Ozemobacteraceae bacterium]